VTDAFARTIGCEPGAVAFSGRRMSGQDVTVPLADGPEIAVGGYARREPAVGVLDIHGFPPALEGIDGFLSLAFFESAPFTVDYGRSFLVVETPSPLEERARSARPSPCGSSAMARHSAPSSRSRCPEPGRSRSRSTWAATS